MSRPSRDQYHSFKSQRQCQNPRFIGLLCCHRSSILDIEQDEIRKALLI